MAVLFAILTPGLLFLFLLVVDVGNWYVHKRHLQMQVDAAALAGGAHFSDCFSGDPAVSGAADTTIENAAIAYAGDKNSSTGYNAQVGSGSSRITTRFNSKTFLIGSYNDPTVETQGPCETPHLMLDVKQTEQDVPYVLASLVSALVPGGTTTVPAINAAARVQLMKSVILSGSLPLAVPDIDPKHVAITYVNENAGGTLIAGPIDLTKGVAANGLNYWSGSSSVTLPDDVVVGVRVSVGAVAGACAATDGTGGTGYVCYDYSDATTGLVRIDSVGTGGTEDVPKARVWATTTCAPSGGPFFAPQNVISPATTCSVSVQAIPQITGGAAAPAKSKLFNAILNGGGLKNVSKPLTYNAANGYWSTGYVYAVSPDAGPVDVTVEWQSTNGGSKKQTYTNVQRVFSGSDDDSGPVKELALTTSTTTAGAPYTISSGSQTITATVGIQGSLNLSTAAQTTMLRLTGGSRSSAVACDGTGASNFRDSIVNGCKTPYQLNTKGVCPDPSPPTGPADCVGTQTGTTAGPTLQGLDARFATCPPVNWPSFDAATDSRVAKLMITDFSSLGGSGTTDVPVTNFAAFYVTGWTGSTCANNDPPPANVDIKKGAIWGHFVKYIEPDPFSGGTDSCDPLAITPCVPVLVK